MGTTVKKIHYFLLFLFFWFGVSSFTSLVMAAVGGLTYSYVNWPGNASYYNMDQLIRIDQAPLVNSRQGYFWSNQFFIGKAVGYFGLQQLPDGSRIVNAAIWDTTRGEVASGFTVAPFDGEGTGIRIFGRYSWVPGRIYRLRVWELSRDWWGFYIQDTVTGIDTYLGEIQNQFDPGKFLNGSITFTEQFSGPDFCSGLAPVKSTWFFPTANFGTVIATKVEGVVSDSAAVSHCRNQIISITNRIKNIPVNQQIVR